MRNTVLRALILLCLIPAAVQAQDGPAVGLYIGFPLAIRNNSSQLFGVQASATVSPGTWFGVTGDFAVHAGEVFAEKSLWTILGGPQFSAPFESRLRPFGHTLFGTAVSGCGTFQNGCRTTAVFSAALGGGIDFTPRKRTGFRAQADDLITTFGSQRQHFLRLSFGVVIPLTSP